MGDITPHHRPWLRHMAIDNAKQTKAAGFLRRDLAIKPLDRPRRQLLITKTIKDSRMTEHLDKVLTIEELGKHL